MIQLLLFPGALSLAFGQVFDGSDVIETSVIALSSLGHIAHMMSDGLKHTTAVNIEIENSVTFNVASEMWARMFKSFLITKKPP